MSDVSLIEYTPGESITMRLPVPPSANRYWRHAVTGKGGAAHVVVYLSEDAKVYRELIRLSMNQYDITPFDGDVIYIAEYYVRKNRDIGNCGKVLQDALQDVAYHDDKQICENHEYRKPFIDGGSVLVTIQKA